ncbi:MAG: hypothetical protein DSZ28_09925 [Thiothrix sp.]|nr:MAG: hypothetical protein DSZ28_09925 [Thiothrix sp.]
MDSEDLKDRAVISDLPEGLPKETEDNPKQRASDDHFERFLSVFERSARRWEMIVYPSMFAFILLAGYGFFLIYSLTNDIKNIARSMDPDMGLHMSSFDQSMQSIKSNVGNMTSRVEDMSSEMNSISKKMNNLSNMEPIQFQIAKINQSVGLMSVNFDLMRRNMATMNRNISKPMSMMNSFMPW